MASLELLGWSLLAGVGLGSSVLALSLLMTGLVSEEGGLGAFLTGMIFLSVSFFRVCSLKSSAVESTLEYTNFSFSDDGAGAVISMMSSLVPPVFMTSDELQESDLIISL